MLEISLIIIGGLITVVVSITAVIKGNKQEAETKRYQEESRELQAETKELQIQLGKKSDQIIALNEELRKLGNAQEGALKKMTKKIPSKVNSGIALKVPLAEEEEKILRNHLPKIVVRGTENIISRSLYQQSGLGIPTINLLFISRINFNLKLTGANADKSWNINFLLSPEAFTDTFMPTGGQFMLYYNEDSGLEVMGNGMPSIRCFSNSHTMYDFAEYELSFQMSFSKPDIIAGGHQVYVGYTDDRLVLEPKRISISSESGLQFIMEKFEETQANLFNTKGSLDLD